MTTTTLSLDLGTKTGWALVHYPPFRLVSGHWDFRSSRFDGAGMRFVRFRKQLIELLDSEPVAWVFYEEVRRHIGADAARVYGALFGVVTGLCEERSVPYEGVPVGTIKRFWTGRGNAPKGAMLAEAAIRGYRLTDDNECDAIALAHFVHDREHAGGVLS